MKHIFFLFFLLTSAAQIQAQFVSEKQALDVANAYFQHASGRDDANLIPLNLTAQRTGSHPPYYVFESANGKGFVLVSGTKAAPPILAFSSKDHFPTGDLNPALADWLKGYTDQLNLMIQDRTAATPESLQKWDEIGNKLEAAESTQYGPYLNTTWDQPFPYNSFCPTPTNGSTHALVGCAAVAMGQIMKFWNYPSVGQGGFVSYTDGNCSTCDNSITGTFSAQIGGTVYDWNNMTDPVDFTNLPSMNAVSLLLLHCGIAARMDYGLTGSGATDPNVANALINNFGYISTQRKYRFGLNTSNWLYFVNQDLYAGRPIIYTGGAHMWVCDGLKDGLYHMNWGWGGAFNDTYWSLDQLNPGGESFNFNQGIICSIYPPNCPLYFDGGGVVTNLQRAKYIHSSGFVSAGTSANIHAGNEITLVPGFIANQGCTLSAYIQSCVNFDGQTPDDRNQTENSSNTTVSFQADITAAPNPFNGTTTITYLLEAAQNVDIKIFNSTGTLLVNPVQSQRQEAATYSFSFGDDNLAPGVYFLIAQIGDRRMTKRLVRI